MRENAAQLVAQFWASLRRFGEGPERAEKPATRWLCWQSAANCSIFIEFHNHRENTGIFIDVGPIAHAIPQRRHRQNREFSLRNKELYPEASFYSRVTSSRDGVRVTLPRSSFLKACRPQVRDQAPTNWSILTPGRKCGGCYRLLQWPSRL